MNCLLEVVKKVYPKISATYINFCTVCLMLGVMINILPVCCIEHKHHAILDHLLAASDCASVHVLSTNGCCYSNDNILRVRSTWWDGIDCMQVEQ